MTLQLKAGLSIAALTLSFAAGNYTARQTQSSTNSKTQSTVQQDVKQDTHEVITTIKAPNGTVQTVETVDTTALTNTDSTTNTQSQLVVVPNPKNNVSALAGFDLSKSGLIPTYGISVNRQFLGPVTIGAFGLTSGTVGVSIGINF